MKHSCVAKETASDLDLRSLVKRQLTMVSLFREIANVAYTLI